MITFFTPDMHHLPFHIRSRMEESPKKDRIMRNILYISAHPSSACMDFNSLATVEFSKEKMNYLQHKGHKVTGAYASTVEEFKMVWNAIGKGNLSNIDKVIIDYHGAISPVRGYESVIVLSPATKQLLDKSHIMQLESKPGVKTVSLYTCYGGFADNFNPAAGFLTKLTDKDAYTVGFDAQGNNDMSLLKTTRHFEAGDSFLKALDGLKVNRSQYGRVKYRRINEMEIMLQHSAGNLSLALSKFIH